MKENITVVHGSNGGYGLVFNRRTIAGAPKGMLKYEKGLPVDEDELAIAISNSKHKEKIWKSISTPPINRPGSAEAHVSNSLVSPSL